MAEAMYNRYRPTLLKHIIGQPEAVAMVQGMVRGGIPHAVMFTGPSGVGKTTFCRVLRDKLGCKGMDYEEINVSDYKGIEMVRNIRNSYGKYAVEGKARVYVLDEAHEMTTQAQNAILKILEDEKEWVYFMIATTDPGKIKDTVKTRCKTVSLKPIPPADLRTILETVAKKEKIKITEKVYDGIINKAGGSARQAIQDLELVSPLEDEQDRLNALVPPAVQATAMDIVKALIPFNPRERPNWKECANSIMTCEEDEKVRQIVLSCAARQLSTSDNQYVKQRAYLTIVAFNEPFFHSRKAGMLAAAYEVYGAK